MLEADQEFQDHARRFWELAAKVIPIVCGSIIVILIIRMSYQAGVESARFEAMSTGVGGYVVHPQTGKVKFIWNTNAITNPMLLR